MREDHTALDTLLEKFDLQYRKLPIIMNLDVVLMVTVNYATIWASVNAARSVGGLSTTFTAL